LVLGNNNNNNNNNKGKAIPLKAWTGPEGCRRLRLPDLKKNRHKVFSPMHRPPLPLGILLVLVYVLGWVNPRAIV